MARPAAKDLTVALLSDDGRILAGSSLSSTVVRLWDTTAGRELHAVAFENEEHIAAQDAIALSPNGSSLATLTETVGTRSARRAGSRMPHTLMFFLPASSARADARRF